MVRMISGNPWSSVPKWRKGIQRRDKRSCTVQRKTMLSVRMNCWKKQSKVNRMPFFQSSSFNWFRWTSKGAISGNQDQACWFYTKEEIQDLTVSTDNLEAGETGNLQHPDRMTVLGNRGSCERRIYRKQRRGFRASGELADNIVDVVYCDSQYEKSASLLRNWCGNILTSRWSREWVFFGR